MIILWIVLGAIGLVVLYVIVVYNRLIRLNVRTDEAWSDIDVQLKRRYNLIPNLIETIKGYAKHEKKVFIDVTKARTEAMKAKGVEEKGKAENQITAALKSIFAVAESYPDLKASQNFSKLQDELADTENKIQASRRFYNGNVRDFNIAVKIFPANVFANMLGFSARELFELKDETARKTPKVSFSEEKTEEKKK